MRHVYVNSRCNIADTASESPDTGMFYERDMPLLLPGLVQTNWKNYLDEKCSLVKFGWDGWRNDIEKSQFHKRRWLQEQLLAPRVLHFGKRQIYWECYQSQNPRGLLWRCDTKDID